jgi:hypothetical protein
MPSYSTLHLPTIIKGQDFRPSNGSHRNTQLEITKIPGKYHQSQNSQPSWSRRQYVPNYVSGANSTPLRSPPRMSPVDSSAVDSSANAAKIEPEKRDSEVLVVVRATVPSTTTNSILRRRTRRTRHNQSPRRRNGTTFPTRIKSQRQRQMLVSCQNYPKNRHL